MEYAKHGDDIEWTYPLPRHSLTSTFSASGSPKVLLRVPVVCSGDTSISQLASVTPIHCWMGSIESMTTSTLHI
jgi:hypothetical protein